MTSRELTSGFDLWSRVKFGTDIFIQSGVIDIFPKFKMAAGFVGGAMGPPTKAHSWCIIPIKISS